MKIIIILLLILSAIFLLGIDGCEGWDQSGVQVTLKQIIPLSTTTRIEITKTINMSDLMRYTSSQDYLLEDSKFYVPIEIENNNNFDYDNIRIYFKITSPLLEYAYLYSYSGYPFSEIKTNYYDFNSKLLARQTNKLLLVGKVGGLPMNLTAGEITFDIGLYNTSNNLIPDTHKPYKIRICKLDYC